MKKLLFIGLFILQSSILTASYFDDFYDDENYPTLYNPNEELSSEEKEKLSKFLFPEDHEQRDSSFGLVMENPEDLEIKDAEELEVKDTIETTYNKPEEENFDELDATQGADDESDDQAFLRLMEHYDNPSKPIVFSKKMREFDKAIEELPEEAFAFLDKKNSLTSIESTQAVKPLKRKLKEIADEEDDDVDDNDELLKLIGLYKDPSTPIVLNENMYEPDNVLYDLIGKTPKDAFDFSDNNNSLKRWQNNDVDDNDYRPKRQSVSNKEGLYLKKVQDGWICIFPECNNIYTTKHHLLRHIESEHEGVTYQCPYDECNNTYQDPSGLSEHIKTKHEGATYPCTKCNKTFTTKGGLRYHTKSQHEGNFLNKNNSLKTPELIGDIDNSVSKALIEAIASLQKQETIAQNSNSLEPYHLDSDLFPNDRDEFANFPTEPSTINLQSQSTQAVKPLKRKSKEIADEEGDEEEEYDYNQKRKQQPQESLYVKQVQDGWTCTFPECHKTFSAKSSVSLHIKTKHEGATYQCPYDECNNTYQDPSGLSRHIKSQHERKQQPQESLYVKQVQNGWMCTFPECNKTFSTKNNLSRHIKSEHEGITYPCKYSGCNKTYQDPSHLSQHIKRKHLGITSSTQSK